MRTRGWIWVVLLACGILVGGGQLINAHPEALHHGDEAELRKQIIVPFDFGDVRWEVFSVPEAGRDSVPGPDDFRVLVAQFDGVSIERLALTPVVSADFFYNSARPWASEDVRRLISQTLNAGGALPRNAKCYSLEVALATQPPKKEPALICQAGGKLLLHVITERR